MSKEQKQKFVVNAEHEDMRLDLFLAIAQDSASRSTMRRLIDSGSIKVNGNIEYRPHYRTRAGDLISVEGQLEPKQPQTLVPQKLDLDIIYEDKDLLVVNKPAGMVIHPATGNPEGTLMNAALYHLQQLQGVGDSLRSGLIHRIDKDTSGLVMIGKTNKGLWYYSKLFAERKVHKKYIAVSAGNIKAKLKDGSLFVRNYLGRNQANRKKFTIVSAEKGRLAETQLQLLSTLKREGREYSVVLAMPKTGRTHQIRVHLSNLGNPILGDVIYGKHNSYSRLMLHAWELQLPLLDGRELVLKAPLPPEFQEFYQEFI